MVSKLSATKMAKKPVRVANVSGVKKPSVTKTYRLEELSPQDRRVQITAARLRVTLDERLKRPTPSVVKALAKEAL